MTILVLVILVEYYYRGDFSKWPYADYIAQTTSNIKTLYDCIYEALCKWLSVDGFV